MNGQSRVSSRDLELVAALADGRLEGRERAEAIARVDADPALLEIYAETLACLEEVGEAEEADEAPAEVLEEERRPWLLPLAAALALAVLGIPLWRTYLAPVSLDPAVLAGMAAPEAGRLAEGWYEPGWPVTRGPEADVPGADLSFRLGVRAVDLEVALEAGAIEDAIVLTHRLESLLEPIDFTEPQRQAYRQVRRLLGESGVGDEVFEYTRVADELNGETGGISRDSYRLGKWAETGRVALAAGDEEAVRSARYRRGARGVAGSNEEREKVLEALRVALSSGSSVSELEARFEILVQAH